MNHGYFHWKIDYSDYWDDLSKNISFKIEKIKCKNIEDFTLFSLLNDMFNDFKNEDYVSLSQKIQNTNKNDIKSIIDFLKIISNQTFDSFNWKIRIWEELIRFNSHDSVELEWWLRIVEDLIYKSWVFFTNLIRSKIKNLLFENN